MNLSVLGVIDSLVFILMKLLSLDSRYNTPSDLDHRPPSKLPKF